MAAAQARDATPPPVIGRAGRYTVFLTPPAIPKPPEAPKVRSSTPEPSPRASPGNAGAAAAPLPSKAPYPPPVQVPPPQFGKPSAPASGSAFGFLWDAVAKVQDVHSSLDEYLADWFGLNQSRYQWALNDYYENNGMDKEGGKQKENVHKGQVA